MLTTYINIITDLGDLDHLHFAAQGFMLSPLPNIYHQIATIDTLDTLQILLLCL